MQDMFLLDLEFALSKSDTMALDGLTWIGLWDDMTFIGSAAALNRSWNVIEGTLADAGHRLRGCRCGVWAPGCEQFEDRELPTEVRDLCVKVPRKRLGVSLLGSAANMHHCVDVGLGQPAELPTRLRGWRKPSRRCRALRDLLAINTTTSALRRCRCDRPAATTPGRRAWTDALSAPWNAVSELAWERAKLATCFGGLGIRVAQMGFAA